MSSMRPAIGQIYDTHTQTADPTTIAEGCKLYIDYKPTSGYANPKLYGLPANGPRGVVQIEGIATYNNNAGAFYFAPISIQTAGIVRNTPSVARNFTPAWDILSTRSYLADGAAVTCSKPDIGTGPGAFYDCSWFGTANTGTLNLNTDSDYNIRSFVSAPAILGSTTLSRRTAFDVQEINADPNMSNPSIMSSVLGGLCGSTVTVDSTTPTCATQYGLRVPRLTFATTNIGIQCNSPVVIYNDTATFTASPTAPLSVGGDFTLNFTNATWPQMLNFTGIYRFQVDGASGNSMSGIVFSPSIRNLAASSGVDIGTINGIVSNPIVQADGTNVTDTTVNLVAGFTSNTQMVRIAAGDVATITESDDFLAKGSVGTAQVVTTRKAFVVQDITGAGTVTNQYGLDIPSLTKGGTTNVGVRNASTTVYTPATQVVAAGSTLTQTATVLEVTTSGPVTMTSTPHIADGVNGQILIIINADSADTLTFRDQSAIASNMRLPGAANLALGPRDSATFMFNSTLGDWICIGTANN